MVQSAEKQGNQALEMIKFMLEQAGWTLEVKTKKGLLDMDRIDALLKK